MAKNTENRLQTSQFSWVGVFVFEPTDRRSPKRRSGLNWLLCDNHPPPKAASPGPHGDCSQMSTCFRMHIRCLLCLGLISGCVVWSPGLVLTEDSVARMTDGSTEVVVIRRDPEAGGDLTIGWVPLATLEASTAEASKTAGSNSNSVKSLIEKFEYCKIRAIIQSPNSGGESNSQSLELQPAQSDSNRPTGVTIAGRIVSVDENSIVLADAVAIEEPSARTAGIPTGGKNPFTSRMFKNVGVLVQPVSIPGEVHIDLRNIKVIESIDAETWPSVCHAHFERIGIEFDFNLPPSR